jgi:formate dehydrogenase iron-sulfur subunit
VSLPLHEIATEGGLCFLLTPTRRAQSECAPASRIPHRPPLSDEQYRFHLDLTKCIGCQCCEVACNEQNNNPAKIHGRRVGEIEEGSYPCTQCLYLSLGCNHDEFVAGSS